MSAPAPDPRRLAWIPTVLVGILGVLLLDRWPLWEAGIFTLETAQGSLSQAVAGAAADRHPPLHFVLTWLVLRLGDADALLRLPSLAGGLLAAWLTTRFALDRLGPTGLLAGLWLALTPVFLLYLGVARMYALLPALAAALMLASWALGRGRHPVRAAVALGLLTALGLYTHYLLLLPALAAAASALLLGLRADGRRRLRAACAVGASALGGLAFLPWALGPMLGQQGATTFGGLDVHALTYLLWPVDQRVHAVAWLWLLLAGIGAVRLLWRQPALYGPWILAATGGVLALSVNADVVRRQYVHLGMLPVQALCVAAGIEHLLRRRPARQALALGALALVLLQGAPVAALLRYPSLPLGAPQDGAANGVFDSRREAALLKEVLRAPEQLAGEGRASHGLYLREDPGLPVLRGEPPFPEGAWVAEDPEAWRPDLARPGSSATPEAACTAAYALTIPHALPSEDACRRLEAALEVAQAADPHGPFALELAASAWRRGDTARARELAREAAGLMVDPTLAHALRTELLVDEGLWHEARGALGDALAASRLHGDEAAWLRLQALATRVHRELGDDTAAREAEAMVGCAGGGSAVHKVRECGYTPDWTRW